MNGHVFWGKYSGLILRAVFIYFSGQLKGQMVDRITWNTETSMFTSRMK